MSFTDAITVRLRIGGQPVRAHIQSEQRRVQLCVCDEIRGLAKCLSVSGLLLTFRPDKETRQER